MQLWESCCVSANMLDLDHEIQMQYVFQRISNKLTEAQTWLRLLRLRHVFLVC